MEKLKAEDLEQVSGGRISNEMIGKIHNACIQAIYDGKTPEEFLEKILPTMFKGGNVPEYAYKYAATHFVF